jgi:hypothetical protein
MSGVVSVTVRLPDGAVSKMLWPTSRLYHLQVPGVPEKDPETLRELTVIGRGPWPGARPWPSRPGRLAPEEYGLVVVDLAENRIVTRQGAMDLRALSLRSVVHSARNPVLAAAHRQELRSRDPHSDNSLMDVLLVRMVHPTAHDGEIHLGDTADGLWFAEGESDAARAASLYAKQRLTHLVVPRLRQIAEITQNLPFTRILDALREVSRRLERHPETWVSTLACLRIEWSPLEVVDLDGDADGGARFHEILAQAGFRLTHREERIWREREWITD